MYNDSCQYHKRDTLNQTVSECATNYTEVWADVKMWKDDIKMPHRYTAGRGIVKISHMWQLKSENLSHVTPWNKGYQNIPHGR